MRRRPLVAGGVAVAAVAAIVVALLVAGGGEDADAEPFGARYLVTSGGGPEPPEGVEVERGDRALTLISPAGDPAAVSLGGSDVGFHAVEQVAVGVAVQPAGEDTFVLPAVADAEGNVPMLELHPAALGAEAIAGATAAIDGQGAWLVEVGLTAAGTDALDVVATSCFEQDAACPTGQLALAVDGVVLTAPLVTTDDLGATFLVAGLDETEARDLAGTLQRAAAFGAVTRVATGPVLERGERPAGGAAAAWTVAGVAPDLGGDVLDAAAAAAGDDVWVRVLGGTAPAGVFVVELGDGGSADAVAAALGELGQVSETPR